ncbi:phosphopantetheine-binding protein [Nocardia sp. NPDC051052]|uniref:acyl carrier protein n=1 Tax=Nocardia sp. NPDC051052 TaxID=3364322 RepID=UPI0037B8517D
MNAPVPRYIIGVSSRTAETLAAQANTLATYLDATERDPRRAAFATTVTLAAVAKTLLRHRDGLPHRFAFVAATLSGAVESLRFFAEQEDSGNRLSGKGIYASRAEVNLFGDGSPADQNYVRQLATDGSYHRLAALWSVGFPIDWSIVHPELDMELPAYLPPTPLSRQRFWPAAATIGHADRQAPQQPGQTSTAWVSTDTPATFTPAPVVATPEVEAATAPTTATSTTVVPAISTGDLRSELADLPSTLRRQLLRTRLQGWIGAALAYPEGELPAVDMGFFDIGMTSIHLEEVRGRISAALGFAPEETTAFDYPTIAEFAEYLERSLDSEVAQSFSAQQLPEALVEDNADGENVLTALDAATIDELSPVELERVLTAIL